LRERKAVLLSDQVDEGRLGLGISFSALVDEEPSKSWLGVPMLYGDQAIGVIAVQSVTTPGLYTARERDLLAALANQAANAFVLQRQYQQTQAALATTQTIYAASRALVGAASPSEVLDALVAATSLSRFERASLILYERPWQETMPERAIFAASWERDESVPHRSVPPGMAVPMSQVDFASLLSRDKATIISDIASDARLSEPARQMLTQLGVGQSLALFPLFVGRQSIGVVSLSADQSVTFDEDELLQIESLVGEAAAVLQSMQLLQQAESRLRREQVLREITAQVRASSDAEVILRSAVRQLGEALGRQAFVQLAAEDRRAMPGSGQEIDPGGR
jgi:GAF domain-containing protein